LCRKIEVNLAAKRYLILSNASGSDSRSLQVSGLKIFKDMKEKRVEGKLIDLSHTIFEGLVTYKGLPAPVICDYMSREQSKTNYEEGTTFQIGKIEMVTNTGTYIDCPFHRFDNGKDLSEVELDHFADLEAITIDARNVSVIGRDFFTGKEIRNKAVLVFTDWATHWNTDAYFEKHPYLTAEAAEYLKDCQVKLVGIDSHNIDDTGGRSPRSIRYFWVQKF
jgi:arylformamidase